MDSQLRFSEHFSFTPLRSRGSVPFVAYRTLGIQRGVFGGSMVNSTLVEEGGQCEAALDSSVTSPL